jgi:hypothetical protein
LFAAWRVAVVFTAANLTGNAFRGIVRDAGAAEKAVDGNAAALHKLHGIAIGAFATLGVVGVAAFGAVADAASKYQLQMMLLQQQLGATDNQMTTIGKTIMSLSSGKGRTIFGMNDLSLMARNLQQSNLSAEQVNAVLPSVAYAAEIEKLRSGGNIDVGHFASNQGSTIYGYGLAAPGKEKALAEFEDMYTRIASVSHVTSAGLQAFENQAGMYARIAGWSPNDFLESLGFLSQAGIKPQMAGTMVKNLLTNINPRANLTAHAANAQFNALTDLHLLTPADLKTAKTYGKYHAQAEAAIGMPGVDPSKMTAKQQEAYAEALMRVSVSSKMQGLGFSGMLAMFRESRDRMDKTFGKTKGDALFGTNMRTAFNLRGAPAGILMALTNPQAFAEFLKKIGQQKSLPVRAAEVRGTFQAEKDMLPSMLNTLMVQLGGAKPGGKTVAGSPLDIMTKLLGQIENFIGMVTDWGKANPTLIAQIGTLIGLIGVAGLGGVLVLTIGAIVSFVSAVGTALGAFAALPIVVAAWPVLAIAALVAVGVGIVAFFRSPSLRTKVANSLGWIVGTFENLATKIGTAVRDSVGHVVDSILHPKPRGPITPEEHMRAAVIRAHGAGRIPAAPPGFVDGVAKFISDVALSRYRTVNPHQYNIDKENDAHKFVPFSPQYIKSAQEKQAAADAAAMKHVAGEVAQTFHNEFVFHFNGITDTNKIVQTIQDKVNSKTMFDLRRQGGSAPGARFTPVLGGALHS